MFALANPKVKIPGKEIILVSKDVNLRMKAASLGLNPEDYKTDVVKDVNSLYENTEVLLVEDKTIDRLYAEKKLKFPFETTPYENEFIILKSEDTNSNKSALSIFKDGNIHIILKDKFSAFGITPRNAEQAFAMSVLLDPEIKIISMLGKAGTGKTIVALAAALAMLEKKSFDEILFTRETVSMGNRDIGFLPGDASEKLNPYMQGMYDNLAEIRKISGRQDKIADFKRNNQITIEPLPYIRGRSFNDKYFIIDETQNLTPHEMKTIVTRAGRGTKIILIGDTTQIDVPMLDERSNGLSYLIDRFRGQKIYAHVVLKNGERSELAELASILL